MRGCLVINDVMHRSETTARLLVNAHQLRAAGGGVLYLFGWTAQGEAGPEGDVDLFFDPADTRFNLFGVVAVRDAVESLLGCQAYVLTRESLHPHLRPRIEAQARQVF